MLVKPQPATRCVDMVTVVQHVTATVLEFIHDVAEAGLNKMVKDIKYVSRVQK
jgi:hypothetical protein